MNEDSKMIRGVPPGVIVSGGKIIYSVEKATPDVAGDKMSGFDEVKGVQLFIPSTLAKFSWNEDNVFVASDNVDVGDWLNILAEHVTETIAFNDPQSDEFTLFEGLAELLANDWWSYDSSPTSSAMMLVHGSMYAIEQCLRPIGKRNLDGLHHTWFEFGLNQPHLHGVWEYGSSPRGGWFYVDDPVHKVAASYFSTKQGQGEYAVTSVEALLKYYAALVIHYKFLMRDLIKLHPNVQDHIVLRDLYPTNEKLKEWMDATFMWDDLT